MASVVTKRNTTWVAPRTWVNSELVSDSLLNSHLRDQLSALKSPAYFHCLIDEAANYTITNTTSFTDIDPTDLSPNNITTGGGNWLVGFNGYFAYTSGTAGALWVNVAVDNANSVADDGIMAAVVGATNGPISFTWLLTGITAGSHTFSLRWKTSGGSGVYTLYAGAGTANFDIHPLFWGIELV